MNQSTAAPAPTPDTPHPAPSARAVFKLRAYRWAARVAPVIPRRLGLPAAALAGRVAARLAPGARQTVEGNLRQVLGPGAEPDRVRSTAGRVFQNAARNYFDFFRLPALRLVEVDRLVRVEGEAHFWAAHRQGRGVVLATAHLGTFDAAARVFAARRLDVLILVEPIEPPELLDLVAGIRRSHGLAIEPVGPAGLRRALAYLRAGKVVIVVSDRPIQGRGSRISFFGEPALLPTGALDLALRSGAAVVPAFSVRRPDDRFTIFVEPALSLVHTGDRRRDVQSNLGLLRDCLQQYIGAYPDQWVVFQSIWTDGAT